MTTAAKCLAGLVLGHTNVCRESAGLVPLFNENVLFSPTRKKPKFKRFFIVKWDILDGKPPPVHAHRLWRPSFQVSCLEGEYVLSKLSSRHTFVCHRAIVDIVDRLLELLETEVQPSAAR